MDADGEAELAGAVAATLLVVDARVEALVASLVTALVAALVPLEMVADDESVLPQ